MKDKQYVISGNVEKLIYINIVTFQHNVFTALDKLMYFRPQYELHQIIERNSK